MGKVIVVTSDKGGVGKTTSTAAIGAALARSGEKVVVVDFDVGLRNLDLVMGAERRVVHDLVNVVQGVVKLPPALIRDKRIETLFLLPASQTRDKDALTEEGVGRVIAELRTMFDWVICDSPAGIERGATLAMRFADAAVIVANSEVSSVRDSDRIIGLLDSKTVKAEKGERMEKHLLITRFDAARAARGARRDARHRGRARDPVGSAAGHHPGKRGGAARIQSRQPRDHPRRRQPARARLYRRSPAARRRRHRDDHPH
jgi:septum site-determining protein MinD